MKPAPIWAMPDWVRSRPAGTSRTLRKSTASMSVESCGTGDQVARPCDHRLGAGLADQGWGASGSSPATANAASRSSTNPSPHRVAQAIREANRPHRRLESRRGRPKGRGAMRGERSIGSRPAWGSESARPVAWLLRADVEHRVGFEGNAGTTHPNPRSEREDGPGRAVSGAVPAGGAHELNSTGVPRGVGLTRGRRPDQGNGSPASSLRLFSMLVSPFAAAFGPSFGSAGSRP